MWPTSKVAPLSEREIEICARLNLGVDELSTMKRKPLYKFSEGELDRYLAYLQEFEPDLRARVQHLARKGVGQPYHIFLLGEFPVELYDTDPLYSLRESDCVVFSEHMYAMALAHDWPSFFALLQRIRYKDGEIGMLTRNHYTEADWDVNNSWLVEDVTEELAGDNAARERTVIDRARFFRKFGIGQDIPAQTLEWSYIPYQILPQVIGKLNSGDFVNIVRGNEGGKYVGHVGLITRDDDGTVYFTHSTTPKVRQQPLMELFDTADELNEERRMQNQTISEKNKKLQAHNEKVRRQGKGNTKSLLPLKPYFYGFKFFRLRSDPLAELMKVDGGAPQVKFNLKAPDPYNRERE